MVFSRYLSAVRSQLAEAPRTELEQALLRLVLVGAVYVYLISHSLGAFGNPEIGIEPVWVGAAFFAVAIVLMVLAALANSDSPVRRVVGIIADNAATTYFLMQMGESGAIVVGVYLFVTFGNGFRYGRSYLHLSQALGLTGFGLVLTISPFWSQHVGIGIGFLTGLLVLPFYVGVLAERIKEARKRADEANAAKGRFLANVSHEMRTPLNGVIAMADVLRETSLSESQREIVETMTTSASLLLAQIEDVLDMAKIEAGRVKIDIAPFDMGRLLSTAVKIVLPQARYKGLDLQTDVSAGAAGWFSGDSHHLRQVVLNLLANAVKFTERGGVTLRVRVLGNDESLARLRFEVEDTGIGISPEKIPSIFDPFVQADESITRMYGGTGLGTTIAKQLVGMMGGSIGLTSTLNVGTIFWFEIPMHRSEPKGVDLTEEMNAVAMRSASVKAATATNGAKVRKLHSARVLVAEDNQTNQRVTRMILESGGHHVTMVTDGDEALDALERGGFDLALLDLSMPGVSGLEALKLYRFSTNNPIPILMLSANVTSEVIETCLKAGAAEFVGKPVRASLLLDTVERHLGDCAASVGALASPLRTDEKPTLTVVESPLVDPSVLQDLECISPDKTFVDRLLIGFQADCNRLMEEICEALAHRKYDAVKESAHALKGGSASVGATHLTKFATRLEKATHEHLRLKAVQLTEELVKLSTATCTELEAYLTERQSRLRSS